MRARFEHAALVLLWAAAALAQDPPPAPRETVTAAVGGQQVTIEYGRPSLRGRPITELIALLPDDRIWRAGVDAVSTFTTAADVMVGGTRVPAGAYTLYVHAPVEGDWSLVLNRDPGVHLRDLKTTPPIEESATACVECGFCEPVCPSRDLTTTPRQRIVLRREIARQPSGSPELRVPSRS